MSRSMCYIYCSTDCLVCTDNNSNSETHEEEQTLLTLSRMYLLKYNVCIYMQVCMFINPKIFVSRFCVLLIVDAVYM